MLFRLVLVVFLFAACRSGEIGCPQVKGVKLNKRPENYRMRMNQYAVTASAEEEKEKITWPRNTRPVKDAASIEEWDCPKPGTKAQMPKAVKENIRKNRKKFETYYKNRSFPDSLHSSSPAGSRK